MNQRAIPTKTAVIPVMPDQGIVDAAPPEDLLRLQKVITDALAEADRLELRMVGIHLCNALHSLDDEFDLDPS